MQWSHLLPQPLDNHFKSVYRSLSVHSRSGFKMDLYWFKSTTVVANTLSMIVAYVKGFLVIFPQLLCLGIMFQNLLICLMFLIVKVLPTF
jgi:hypothetical protein